jgi:Fe-S-cluster containining protein
MAEVFGLSAKDFRKRYVRRLWRGLSLREKRNYDCVMLDSKGHCMVYEARPLQCRTWPFWPSNLRSPSAWQAAGRRCPGIGAGPLYGFEQIEAIRLEMET